ncbi:MAG TPA: hypothetical protein PLO51_05080 [Candidatus Micrarchaeota archaeon]|nr:hypothetical protein [Candidatus Micrarchaeota archaeon]
MIKIHTPARHREISAGLARRISRYHDPAYAQSQDPKYLVLLKHIQAVNDARLHISEIKEKTGFKKRNAEVESAFVPLCEELA